MFLIVPKRRNTTSMESAKEHPPQQSAKLVSPTTTYYPSNPPPARVSNACDICRNRKVKCNGGMPCSRCLKSESICTYSQLHQKRNGDQTPYEFSLLLQQKRLLTALKSMAALIEDKAASEQPGADGSKPRSSPQRDVNDILAKYAPLPDHNPRNACHDQSTPSTSSRKRRAPYEVPGGALNPAKCPKLTDGGPNEPSRRQELPAEGDSNGSPNRSESLGNSVLLSTIEDSQLQVAALSLPHDENVANRSSDDVPLAGPNMPDDSRQLFGKFDQAELFHMVDWNASWQYWTETFPNNSWEHGV